MKECPSCHHRIPHQLVVCSNCGYAFDSEEEEAPQEEADVKKTMMGIPSIDLNALAEHDVREERASGARQTMFGFPVNDAFTDPEELDEGTDAYEESATQIVDADQFVLPDDAQGGAARVQNPPADSPLRSTVRQGIPSLSDMEADSIESEASQTLDDEEGEHEDGRTMVASASAFKFDGEADVNAPSHDEAPQFYERPKKHETLMGMTLDDLAPSAEGGVKQTLFSIPAHRPDVGEGLSEFSDESEAEEDIPTQAISGSAFMEEPAEDSTREQNRRRLLDKLRAHQQSEAEEEVRAARNTMFGLPAVSESSNHAQSLDQAEESEGRDDVLTPHTGVLKVARKSSDISEVSDLSEKGSSAGVLGSSYMLGKEASQVEQEEEEEGAPSESLLGSLSVPPPKETSKPLPPFDLGKSLRDKLKKNAAKQGAAPVAPKLAMSTEEGDTRHVEDSTQVVDKDMLMMIDNGVLGSLEQDSAATRVAPQEYDVPQADAAPSDLGALDQQDMTREQNLDDLYAQLEQASDEDATRQHDIKALREQLDASSLDPLEGEDEDKDSTSVSSEPLFSPADAAPSREDKLSPADLPSKSGPQFAVPTARPGAPVEQAPAESLLEELDVAPLLDDSLVEPHLPELDVEPLEAPQPLHAEEPAVLPIVAAEPLPVEPSYKTVSAASSPTPPHGTTVNPAPAGAPIASTAEQEQAQGVGQVFMLVFALLSVLSFLGATILPLIGVLHDVSPGTPLIVYAPALLALLAIAGAVIPAVKGRQALFALVLLAGLGLFGLCLAMGAPFITATLSLIGALFALAALLFPLIARSL